VLRRNSGIKEVGQHVMEEMAKDCAEKPDGEVQTELLKRVSKKNYIPDRVKEDYGKAFLREFERFLGKPYEEEAPQGPEIKILGPGCIQCDRLEQELMEVITEMNLAADIEHVANISEIGRYGVTGTPALVINGKVKSVGRVPSRTKMIEWLREFQQ